MSEPPSTPQSEILATVARYYAERLRQFGPTALGVDWNSPSSQRLRFLKLLSVFDEVIDEELPEPRTLLDYGCGYGALLDVIRETHPDVAYCGYDISTEMIAAARSVHAEEPHVTFTSDPLQLERAVCSVASGIFNVKLGYSDEAWSDYVMETMATLDRLSRRAFAFNMLTTYSDVDRRRPDLYYGDPCRLFDLCKRRFSTRVALLHDYPLYEFTIVVRK